VETITYLDTHLVVWLHAGQIDLIPHPVRDILESSSLLLSPMVDLELEYLFEIGRVIEPAFEVRQNLDSKLNTRTCNLDFGAVASEACRQTWTRDPFDRIITGQAAVNNAQLLTKDKKIRDNYANAIWGD